MSERSEAIELNRCVCVWREFSKNAENTLISNEEINTSLMCFLILGQECRWFVVSVAVGVL